MTMKEYEEVGSKHTNKDVEVDDEFLINNERRLNRHISMMLEIFSLYKF